MIEAGGDVLRQRHRRIQRFTRSPVNRHPMAHRREDVVIRIFRQIPPHGGVALKGHLAVFAHHIHQARKHGGSGDVFFGIIRAHLLLVDVFLKDIAEHIRVDLILVAQGPFVQVTDADLQE